MIVNKMHSKTLIITNNLDNVYVFVVEFGNVNPLPVPVREF